MTRTKNVVNLSERGKRNLRSLYNKYFKEECNYTDDSNPIARAKLLVRVPLYSITMLRRIENGDSISFASMDLNATGRYAEDAISGFITGYVEGDEATITHFFVDVTNPGWRREHIFALYKVFASAAMRCGATKVRSENSIRDHINIDLDNLGFETVKFDEEIIEYAKRL